MDEDYDELGNYIGAAEYSDSSVSDREQWEDISDSGEGGNVVQSVYGPNVDVAHYKHDIQDIKVPLIAPHNEIDVPRVVPENWDFHKGLMNEAQGLIRNIAIVGHVNHGKSSFVELFTGPGTTNHHHLEHERGLTLELSCFTTTVQSSVGKSFVFNIADTPGHVDFIDDARAGLSLADGSILIVDVVEGPVLDRWIGSEVIIINKIDRLILELRLTPQMAFDRIKYLVEQELKVDPSRVVFMSTKFQFAFTLDSFASIYKAYQEGEGDLELWNEVAFTSFVLEPLYKLFSYGLLGSSAEPALSSLGITLTNNEIEESYDGRIRSIVSQFFEDHWLSVIVDAIVSLVDPPTVIASGTNDFTVAKQILLNESIYSLVRVNRDLLSSDSRLLIPFGSAVIETENISAGNWALVPDDLPNSIPPSGRYIHVGIEPSLHSLAVSTELVKCLETLDKLYTGLNIQALESGEYFLAGTGELYLDCALESLRRSMTTRVRVGQPSARLLETVSETSYLSASTKSPSGDSSITVVASPIATELPTDLPAALADAKQVLKQAGWSQEEVDSIWAICNGNVLSECSGLQTLELATNLKDMVIQGFEWACGEGPLIEAPLRNVNLRVAQHDLRGTIQLVSTMRRACHAAVLVASPRIVEPWAQATIIGPLSVGRAVYSELAKRRGKVVSDDPIFGTNLYTIKGLIPFADSFGFEIDVLCNVARQNEAQVLLEFHSWKVVEGDPLDTNVPVPRLKPAVGSALARDYMIKTRKRRGLTPDPALEKYFDQEALAIISS